MALPSKDLMVSESDSRYSSLAWNMVDQQLRRRGIRDQAVLRAMVEVPRHRFVSPENALNAYKDCPLPTADGQTISQPYMVAMMTELLAVKPGMRVLEIGTGSGYQTAVLAHMGAIVVSVERSATLAQRARKILNQLGFTEQVKVVEVDGTLGCPENAPYDGIIVTAGAPRLPRSYSEQSADGGRIVIPIGDLDQQNIYLFECHGDRWTESRLIGCKFVPLVGQDGWSPDEVASPVDE